MASVLKFLSEILQKCEVISDRWYDEEDLQWINLAGNWAKLALE